MKVLIEKAEKLIELAKEGADAVKFQLIKLNYSKQNFTFVLGFI